MTHVVSLVTVLLLITNGPAFSSESAETISSRPELLSLLADDPAAETPGVSGYTYSCWLNGWRKNANDRSADIFGIETSRYGFTLDVADFGRAKFGLLSNPVSYEQALAHKAETLETLPPAQLLIELEVNGTRYIATTCKAGTEKGVKRLSNVRMWESGRYVQHYDFLGLDFRNPRGESLACDGTLDLVAWPGSLTFNLTVSPAQPWANVTVRLGLTSETGTWRQEIQVEGPWQADDEKSLSMTCHVPSTSQLPVANITVSTENGQAFPVQFDRHKNCYVASVTGLTRDWKTGYTDIRQYDEFTITVNSSGVNDAVPFLLDLRAPANVTGLCPILCDDTGRPTGLPVQLSKNWHYGAMGPYLMAYTMLPANTARTYTLRVVYGFYGTLPSASHAQLSLVGYGGHGRWDQLAIGCWGETICFDMDMSLVDVAVTDIRMLMARNGLSGRKWSWTEAGWGGDWLNIQDDSQAKYFWNHMKTAYLSQGPCLTHVKHEGYYGVDQEVDFSAEIQTLRTDDYSRVFQTFRYTFTQDVLAKKMWLFKLGRTFNYYSPEIAYGNRDGCLEERVAPAGLKKGQHFVDQVRLTGPAPWWVTFSKATSTAGKDQGTGYRALIIRSYRVVAGGQPYTQPTISVPVYVADPLNLDIELLAPEGVNQFGQGDSIELDLELITLPREAEDYYGPNEAFRKHLADFPNSWKTTHREARGNDLNVKVTGGKARHNYPLVIQVEDPEVTVTIEGGVGVVPIRFEGLISSQGNRLVQVIDGERVDLDQSVHGNDFWQTEYDVATTSYRMSFNLPLDGWKESQWILTQEP